LSPKERCLETGQVYSFGAKLGGISLFVGTLRRTSLGPVFGGKLRIVALSREHFAVTASC